MTSFLAIFAQIVPDFPAAEAFSRRTAPFPQVEKTPRQLPRRLLLLFGQISQAGSPVTFSRNSSDTHHRPAIPTRE